MARVARALPNLAALGILLLLSQNQPTLYRLQPEPCNVEMMSAIIAAVVCWGITWCVVRGALFAWGRTAGVVALVLLSLSPAAGAPDGSWMFYVFDAVEAKWKRSPELYGSAKTCEYALALHVLYADYRYFAPHPCLPVPRSTERPFAIIDRR